MFLVDFIHNSAIHKLLLPATQEPKYTNLVQKSGVDSKREI